MTKLSECFCFDLADALARYAKIAPDLFECAASAVLKAEPELKHSGLAFA